MIYVLFLADHIVALVKEPSRSESELHAERNLTALLGRIFDPMESTKTIRTY